MVDSSVLKIEVKSLFKGKWKTAIFVAIFPIIFGYYSFFESYKSIEEGNFVDRIIDRMSTAPWIMILGIILAGYLISVVLYCLSSILRASSDYTFLEWIRTKNSPQDVIKGITQGFKSKYMLGIVKVSLLLGIYTFLWSLLFIVPGIIKIFSYSQSILVYKDMVDHASLNNLPMPKANDAIRRSREIMSGNKGRLFVLHLSFIGWEILAIFTLGIGMIWLVPYMNATCVNFYHHLNIRYTDFFEDEVISLKV